MQPVSVETRAGVSGTSVRTCAADQSCGEIVPKSNVCVRYKDLVDDEDHERLTRVLTALEKKDEMQQRMEAITKSVLQHCPLPPPPPPTH